MVLNRYIPPLYFCAIWIRYSYKSSCQYGYAIVCSHFLWVDIQQRVLLDTETSFIRSFIYNHIHLTDSFSIHFYQYTSEKVKFYQYQNACFQTILH